MTKNEYLRGVVRSLDYMVSFETGDPAPDDIIYGRAALARIAARIIERANQVPPANPPVTMAELTVFSRFPWMLDAGLKPQIEDVTRRIVEAQYANPKQVFVGAA